MNDLMAVFNMEISAEARIRILKKLGRLINHQYGSNVTEEIIVELVLQLDPNNDILNDEHYKNYVKSAA